MLIELLGHGGMSQYYRQDGQPLGLRHRDTVNATVLQSVTVMQQTNQTNTHPSSSVTIRGLLYAKEMTFRERMARLQSSKPHQGRGAGGCGG